jgi:plasmid stability protein
MANITVRNIPEALLQKLRTLSTLSKRSLNNEILMVLEKGIVEESESRAHAKEHLLKDTQIKIWQNLCGRWKDSRSTADIISDIIGSRSQGREINL